MIFAGAGLRIEICGYIICSESFLEDAIRRKFIEKAINGACANRIIVGLQYIDDVFGGEWSIERLGRLQEVAAIGGVIFDICGHMLLEFGNDSQIRIADVWRNVNSKMVLVLRFFM